MRNVRICVELPDEHFRAFEAEAKRRGVTVESLVQQMMQGLLQDLEREEREGQEHLIFPS